MMKKIKQFFSKNALLMVAFILSLISISAFIHYYQNGLGIAYNDARSHLDIGRRIVEGLTPGIAQIGSVWLPLTHLLMVATVWNNFMWHSGLAGAIQSMVAYVVTGVFIFLFLEELGVGIAGRLIGVAIFALNPNVLYLQSTAMTEPMFMGTMTASFYYFLLWHKEEKIKFLIAAAFWIMLSSLVRYDGWFLLFLSAMLLLLSVWKRKDWRSMEGKLLLFCALGGLGIIIWLLWNLLIFGDPLYFAFGPTSAHAQQDQLQAEGVLLSKGNWFFSAKVYLYSWVYNSGILNLALSVLGIIVLFFSKKIQPALRYASLLLFAPLLFNILALYLGHSVVNIRGLTGDTWFNVRYGVLMMPSVAIFIGFLVDILGKWRFFQVISIIILIIVNSFSAIKNEAVSVQDARFGASQKNVSEVSAWLHENTGNQNGFILISAASHDAVIFSSGLPMVKFIHEGTRAYYKSAIQSPDHWARWIVMRTGFDEDSTWKALKDNPALEHYELVGTYPFADVYALKKEYLGILNSEPIFNQ